MRSPLKSGHDRAVRSFGYALTLDTSHGWEGLSIILSARTTTRERAAIAYAALISLEEDVAYLTASAAIFGTLNGEVLQ
ncbi:MAG: hypothetical protein ABJG04_00595 [Roseobacter sp.]